MRSVFHSRGICSRVKSFVLFVSFVVRQVVAVCLPAIALACLARATAGRRLPQFSFLHGLISVPPGGRFCVFCSGADGHQGGETTVGFALDGNQAIRYKEIETGTERLLVGLRDFKS